MDTYENSKANVKAVGSCIFGGHRKCHVMIMQLNMDFLF